VNWFTGLSLGRKSPPAPEAFTLTDSSVVAFEVVPRAIFAQSFWSARSWPCGSTSAGAHCPATVWSAASSLADRPGRARVRWRRRMSTFRFRPARSWIS